ncbi:hypothetical protein [Microbacterium album]|nr:hypothetical protein [Microbacterium album]
MVATATSASGVAPFRAQATLLPALPADPVTSGTGSAQVEIPVAAPAFPLGELEALAQDALARDAVPGIRLTFGGPLNDGSGLQFGVWELPHGRTLEQIAQDIGTDLDRPDIPITVVVARIVAAGG